MDLESTNDFVGMNVDEACSVMENDSSFDGLVIHRVPDDSFVTMDHRQDRIRVRYNKSTNLVTSVRVG